MYKQNLKLRAQQRQTAIINILVDSYAHNISAHSLAVLNWWFRERADWLKAQELIESNQDTYKKQNNTLPPNNPLMQYGKTPLSREIYPLFKFLLEKGAFWSGITRKTNFGGKINNLYDLFWYDFINSPLYLGTIANTEGINRINLHITVYDKTEEIDAYRKKRIVKKRNGKKLSGKFVEIDLWKVDKTTHLLSKKYEEINQKSSFVHLGEAFEDLRIFMTETEVFLPGGVVGKHSLFTIIENEIRNVKHYAKEERKVMREKGLDLHLSFQAINVKGDTSSSKKELYQIGVWLGHANNLIQNDELRRQISKLYDVGYTLKFEKSNTSKSCSNSEYK